MIRKVKKLLWCLYFWLPWPDTKHKLLICQCKLKSPVHFHYSLFFSALRCAGVCFQSFSIVFLLLLYQGHSQMDQKEWIHSVIQPFLTRLFSLFFCIMKGPGSLSSSCSVFGGMPSPASASRSRQRGDTSETEGKTTALQSRCLDLK